MNKNRVNKIFLGICSKYLAHLKFIYCNQFQTTPKSFNTLKTSNPAQTIHDPAPTLLRNTSQKKIQTYIPQIGEFYDTPMSSVQHLRALPRYQLHQVPPATTSHRSPDRSTLKPPPRSSSTPPWIADRPIHSRLPEEYASVQQQGRCTPGVILVPTGSTRPREGQKVGDRRRPEGGERAGGGSEGGECACSRRRARHPPLPRAPRGCMPILSGRRIAR